MMMLSVQSKLRSVKSLLAQRPDAEAVMAGSAEYPNIKGTVDFIQLKNGVLVAAEVFGLPKSGTADCGNGIFALHLHEGGSCAGTPDDPFSSAGAHYNSGIREHNATGICTHPYHAGDMPPLFANDGYAFLVFFTNRFSVEQIIGRTMVIHSSVDDFTSQPSGNAGKRIACGIIR